MRIPFFLFLALALVPQLGFACPLGKGETQLTLERVMRNFGRFTLPAMTVAQNGTASPASVKDSDLREAIDALKQAESCAQAVVNADGKSLLPSRADGLQGPERDAYIHLFLDTMKNFLEGLGSYEGALATVLGTPAEKRDFSSVQSWNLEIQDRATRAHGILQ